MAKQLQPVVVHQEIVCTAVPVLGADQLSDAHCLGALANVGDQEAATQAIVQRGGHWEGPRNLEIAGSGPMMKRRWKNTTVVRIDDCRRGAVPGAANSMPLDDHPFDAYALRTG